MNQRKQFLVLGRLLGSLGFKNYVEYLSSPHWRDFRRRYYAKMGKPPCSVCFNAFVATELHHRNYNRLGRERFRDVVALCRSCHEKTHAFARADSQVDFHVAHQRLREQKRRE